MIQLGTCRLCKRKRFVLAEDGALEERLDSIATMECDCRDEKFKKNRKNNPEKINMRRWI